MKQSKSNINLLKKAKERNYKKTNIFKTSSGNQNLNYLKANNPTNRKNYLISLLDKKAPKTINTNKFSFNKKQNKNKEIYLTSEIENINIDDKYKNRNNHGNINIRLNLNNEIINNNFNNYYTTKNKNFHKSKSHICLNEKIKEKDKLITKLQKELLQSQELLNQIQKDKQNELTITYNTIKRFDRLDKKNNHSLIALLKSPSLLKFNYNYNYKTINNSNHNSIFNLGLYSSNNRKFKIASSQKTNYIKCFSSSPRRFFSYRLDNLESYNSNYSTKNSLYQKSINKIRLKNKSNSNIFMKKNDKFSSASDLYLKRQLSYSNYNYKYINNNNNSFNKEFKDKCQKLKRRAKLLLNNYIELIK